MSATARTMTILAALGAVTGSGVLAAAMAQNVTILPPAGSATVTTVPAPPGGAAVTVAPTPAPPATETNAAGTVVPAPANALEQTQQPTHSLGQNPTEIPLLNQVTGNGKAFLEVPLVLITPGGVPVPPVLGQPEKNLGAAQRGQNLFAAYNCSGCHAPNGGGGMGLSLSNGHWKFGADPVQHYLVISHGMPLGMPSWGAFLPDNVIWDLVAYVDSIAKPSSVNKQWGTTYSKPAGLPRYEQVPSEFQQTMNPWQHLEPFSYGRKPTNHPMDAPPVTPATVPVVTPPMVITK